MGVHRRRGGPGRGSREPLNALVVPDVPSFAVDGGFRYRIPATLTVSVGSTVRVPLSGRRVRGWVVALDDGSSEGLKEIRQVSGEGAIFSDSLLQTLRWTAQRYVAPLSTVLPRSGPPNLPRSVKLPTLPPQEDVPGDDRAAWFGSEVAARRRPRSMYVLVGSTATLADRLVAAIGPVVAAERSAMVVAATAVEARALAESLRARFGRRVIEVTPEVNPGPMTTRWSRLARQSGLIAVGTERIAFWPILDLALAIIVDEGRRGMKARQTPTVHVREVLRSRSSVEQFGLVMMGRVPTTEALAAGVEVVHAERRLWPLVEVVDRTEEPPGGGVVTDRARVAIRGVVSRGGTVFVFTHRLGYAPAFRCVRCRSVRVCQTCGSRASSAAVCSRCGIDLGPCSSCSARQFEPLGAAVGRVVDELRGAIGHDVVGEVGAGLAVSVGTERDLVGVSDVDLALAVDADGLILGTNYRAKEESLRLLARVASIVGDGRGRRMMLQTAQPHHPVVAALRHGDPMEVLQGELDERAALGFPPAGDLVVVEVRNGPEWTGKRIREVVEGNGVVLGPVETPRGLRWLLQGADLGSARQRLRSAVQEIRDGGGTVRVDVDPLDL